MMLNSPSIERFCTFISEESSLVIENLWDGPKALLLSLIARHTGKHIVVMTAESQQSRLIDNCPYFNITQTFDFPSWETLPGESILPSPDIVGRRLQILYNLADLKTPSVLFCSLQAILQKVPALPVLKKSCSLWKKGDSLSFNQIQPLLESLGYVKKAVVCDKGEYAVRGGIVDIFPLASADPCRVDFFGDQIEDIRLFDPIGQKTVRKIDSVFLCPANEELLLKEQEAAFVLDYLGENTLVIFDDLLALEEKNTALKSLPGANSRTFATFDELYARLSHLSRIFFPHHRLEDLSEVFLQKESLKKGPFQDHSLVSLKFEIFQKEILAKRWSHPFIDISNLLPLNQENLDLKPTYICFNDYEEKYLREKHLLGTDARIERGYLSSGFALNDSQTALIPSAQLTGRHSIRRQKWRSTYHTETNDFHKLEVGALVVHFHHGIGKYTGIETHTNNRGIETEFLCLEYAEKSKILVPIEKSYLITRYIGAHEEHPQLHKIGTKSWIKAKTSAETAIIGYAQDLLKINAERTLKGGFIYPQDSELMQEFEESFPYVETEDQLRAIEALKKDMTSSKAMDRLICGDVGFGKTEVAMRAAFKAVVDGGKQVAVLVPTTVLAMQHCETFCERMASYPVKVREISRFKSAKEIKKTLEEALEGKVDILVGTHRLLSKDIGFKNLGLIIIDEEQKFGVKAKEHLKTLKTGVDCITLTATPIPRTLYLSLVGAKEISTINTPPQDRLPIKTILTEKDPHTIQNGILRELARGGQVFFIHNRVESIFSVSKELQKLAPQARIAVAHGQMSPDELDLVFHAFKKGDVDILVSTTIVENGIDIPNANTILIDDADRFGLAELHQLRGRVGRWNKPAYAYFLVAKNKETSEIARKRLQALVDAQGHAGGMKIAMRDLEIRGAGDILGTQQSGQISAIGFHLYCKLLKKTVDSIEKNSEISFTETKMEFSYEASLPHHYISEISLRWELYHRIGEASSVEEVQSIFSEIKDRFGSPPSPVIWLYHLSCIRVIAAQNRFTLLKFGSHTLYTERLVNKVVVKKTYVLSPFKKPADLQAHLTASILV